MPAKRRHRFRGVVSDVEYFHRASGAMWITHFDPKFVARVHVISGEEPFVEGSEHRFAIHSVVQTFFVDPKGVAFDFELTHGKHGYTLAATRHKWNE